MLKKCDAGGFNLFLVGEPAAPRLLAVKVKWVKGLSFPFPWQKIPLQAEFLHGLLKNLNCCWLTG